MRSSRCRARLEAESRRVAAETGPARFLAMQLGTDAETVVRRLGDDRSGASRVIRSESAVRARSLTGTWRVNSSAGSRRGPFT